MTQDTEDVVARVKRLLPVSWDNELDGHGEPTHANMTFGEHQTQAMSLAPDDWMALNAVPDLLQSLSDRIDGLTQALERCAEEAERDCPFNVIDIARTALHQEGIAP